MIGPVAPRVLAGGVKTVEKERVDRVFEIVRPRSLVGGGTSVYMYGGELDLCGGAPYGWFLLFLPRGSCLVQPEWGAGGGGGNSGRFNDAGLGS